MKFLVAITILNFWCQSSYATIPINGNRGNNLLEPESKMVHNSYSSKPVETKHSAHQATKMQEFINDKLMIKTNRLVLKYHLGNIRQENHYNEGQEFSTLSPTLNSSVTNILDRIQKNYDKFQKILQNRTHVSGSPNAITYSNGKLPETFKERFKRSDMIVENKTDVEYQKYGGYISTKIFLPLGTAEDVTSPYGKENDKKTEDTDPVTNGNEKTTNENYYAIESRAPSVAEKPRLSLEDKETFIQLMDEYADKHISKT